MPEGMESQDIITLGTKFEWFTLVARVLWQEGHVFTCYPLEIHEEKGGALSGDLLWVFEVAVERDVTAHDVCLDLHARGLSTLFKDDAERFVAATMPLTEDPH